MTRARDISNVITNADLAGDIDVDGTANLDVVDIDGALTQDGGAVFNEAGASVDFRVEGDTDTNAFVVDASADRVGIGESAPASKLEITAGVNSHGLLRLNDSDAGNLGGYMQFDSNGTNKANVQNANNAGIHLCVGTGGSVVFTNLGYTSANALEDYEEGTFTPNFIGSGDNYGATHTFRFGQYTKIGDTVYFTLRCASSSVTSNSDQVYISGLPFSANYGNSGISDGFAVVGNGMKIDFGVGYIYANMTDTNSVVTLLMQGYNVGSGSGIDNFRQHDMYASHDVRISGFYKTTS